jgi:hypothetical protein
MIEKKNIKTTETANWVDVPNGRYVGIEKGKYIPELYGELERKILMALWDPQPPHTTMLWVGMTLRSVHIPLERALEIFQECCHWKKYDPRLTRKYIYAIYHHKCAAQKTSFSADDHGAGCSLVPKPTPEELILRFLSVCKPWRVLPPDDISMAILYYHSLGAHIIPMAAGKKPAVLWKPFQTVQPTLSILKSWIRFFGGGMALLGTAKHSFLDIDISREGHETDIKDFDVSRLEGWSWERTKHGGIHVFGMGRLQSTRTNGAEIKGIGTYIVAAPSPGYVFHGKEK